MHRDCPGAFEAARDRLILEAADAFDLGFVEPVGAR